MAGLVATIGIGVPAAVAQPGTISGTITAEDTGQPLPGGCVNAWIADTFEFVEFACADAAGNYEFIALQPGTGYRIQAEGALGYLGEWAFDKRSFDEADVITLPATVNFALEPAVTISGVVTDEDTGDPVFACINAFDQDFTFAGADWTEDDGSYAISTLRSGVGYRLEVTPSDTEHVAEWAFHKTIFDDADVIVAPSVANIPLLAGDRIEGTVTAADTGEPVPNACIRAWFADSGGLADVDCTNEAGQYALAVPVGREYRVEARGTEQFLGEWAFDKASEEEADLVTSPSVVDFALDRLARFTGTLTLPDGSPPEFGSIAIVSATEKEDIIDVVSSDETGQWSIGVRPGDYKIQASAFPFLRWALDAPNWETADVLSVGPGEVRTVDIQLPPLGTITGKVTDADSGTPLAGICVRVIDPVDESSPADDVCTGADGRYSIGVPEGTYAIRFRADDGTHTTEWYRNKLRQRDATPVFVGPGATVKANAVLKRGAKITGLLLDPVTGGPIGACVSARDPQTLDLIESQFGGCADLEGRFTIGGLPTGKVLLWTPGDRNMRPEAWAPGVPTAATALKYEVESGQTADVGEFNVPIGGILRGRVTDQAGVPLPGMVVTPIGEIDRSGGDVRVAVTDANGEYELGGLSLAPFVPGAFSPGAPWAGSGRAASSTARWQPR